MDSVPEALTVTLRAAHAGDREAADRAYEALYPQLERIARARLRAHQPDTLLDTQSLVHESFLHLVACSRLDIQDRGHFFAYAAKVMRHIIIDFARRRQAECHGGGLQRVTLDTAALGHLAGADEAAAAEILDIDRALGDLDALDPKLARVVEMRFFGGFDDAEIAQALDVTDRSVRRYWDKARAYLVVRLAA